MPNVFKRTGQYYTSKSGNDGNTATDPNTPNLTIQGSIDESALGSDNLIIGAGVYKETLSSFIIGHSLLPDGLLYIDGTGLGGSGTGIQLNSACTVGDDFNVTYIQNWAGAGQFALSAVVGCNLGGVIFRNNTIVGINEADVNNCIFYNNQEIKYKASGGVTRCTFVDCNVIDYDGATGTNNWTDVIFVDSAITPSGIYERWNNCCFFNTTIDGQDAATYAVNNPSFFDDCVFVDPQFNNKSAEDFTLSTSSPILTSGFTGSFIGARPSAISLNGNDSAMTGGGGATINNLSVDGDGFFTITAGTSGDVTSAAVDTGRVQELGILEVQMIINDPLERVDYDNTTANPNNFTVRMSWGDTEGAANGASLQEFKIGKKVTVDSMGRGNGDPNFDTSTETPIISRWVVFEETLINNGIGG